MPKSLVKDLGARYVRDFFAGALFVLDGKVMKFLACNDEDVSVKQFSLNLGTPKWESAIIKADKLEDFTTFKWPKLGYRQFKQGKMGNIVVQLSCQRNAQRGLKADYLRWARLPVFEALDITGLYDGFDQVNDARRAKEIFAPTFTPFSEGIKQLLSGESLGFAVNEDLAVALCTDAPDRGFDVYYRGRVVGNVDNNGTINIVNKILQRDTIKKKLFK